MLALTLLASAAAALPAAAEKEGRRKTLGLLKKFNC